MTAPIYVPPLCDRHRHDLVVTQLALSPSDPWRAAEVTANVLLFQGASAQERVWKRAGDDPAGLSLVLAELGCLGCWDGALYMRVVALLRKGLKHAVDVAYRRVADPDWTVFDGAKEAPGA